MQSFIILQDHLAEQFESDRPDTFGQSGQFGDMEYNAEDYPHEFTLLDDDRELYYTGRAADEGPALEAAMDWGMAFAGCTILQMDGEDVIS